MRWSIRSLFIAIALIGLALTIPRWQSLQRHYAAQQLRRHGVEVILENRRKQQTWLSRVIFGDDSFEWVYAILIKERSLSRADILRLASFPRLTHLVLFKCPTVDAVLAETPNLHCLEVLHIEDSPVTGRGIRSVGKLSSLRNLRLIDVELKEVDLKVVSELSQLKYLSLSGKGVNDSVLRAVSSCRHIDHLGLRNTNITDDGLRSLVALHDLSQLVILESRISGTGLVYVADAPKLESLTLRGCPITDAGLEAIRQIKTLKFLGFNSSLVTQEAVIALEQALPQCAVGSPFYKEPVE